MASTRSRRLVPLVIVTVLGAGGATLTTTAATAATAAPVSAAGITTDTDPPWTRSLLRGLGKIGILSKVGTSAATGGYTQPPGSSGSDGAARGGDTEPPGSSDPGPGDNVDYGIWTDPGTSTGPVLH
ncbi:hypothetical protein [Streptomyces sp. HUAS TT3]|uniref:hypothetical protein n=1 Tax=Streptomyces sp. HUAS TT3 TaxID=3447510 RepID=UPI003F657213